MGSIWTLIIAGENPLSIEPAHKVSSPAGVIRTITVRRFLVSREREINPAFPAGRAAA